ncbi:MULTISPECIES: histidine phosphatase family protein [Rhizobium]|uniref:Histidine phosphatase family protein n=1 Tax=Rhizobium wuzhouense TaxID=1986026 RepID=A0ABX5NVK3_9HYPH|nr:MULTISPECIES: histidine phosphatase family protein [Rhizobium]PYB77200.1 histidine phosphatase family protein [Rhizobium wuzhouense]RKE85836.1 putative phosphoglycerate mutase [Rhizobium sp. AG855]
MLIYMIRHGQTDWNAEGRMQGQKDIGLNDIGRAQASENGRKLGQILGETALDFDFVSSPLWRTRDTMERVRSSMGLPPERYRLDERLKELSFGDWEGSTLPELARVSPERVAERARQKWSFIPPGDDAESYEILSWRIGAWLASVDRATVCVSHGGVIRSCFRLIGNVDENEACEMNIPQDRILKMELEPQAEGGSISWI